MAAAQARTRQRQILALMVLSVLALYALPLAFEVKSPRLTPKDQLSPLEIADLEAQALRQEIASLQARVEMLQARSALAEKAQNLALEKSREAELAFAAAERTAKEANAAFDEADLKEQEAKQALRYARMTERQARDALAQAGEKEKIAQTALATARLLEEEASKALDNAQTQSKLAKLTLDEIRDLEAKIAELNQEIQPAAQTNELALDETQTNKARMLPDPGKAVLVYEARLVPPTLVNTIPKDLDSLSVKARKERFVEVLLPLILKANQVLENRRTDLQQAIAEGNRAEIDALAKLYGVSELSDDDALNAALLERVAPVPASLALAQAAVESGWGQSRFVIEGNALYGQWAWSADQGIKPLDASNARAVIRSFATLYDSVFAYMHNLNTHYAYADFREERAAALMAGKRLSGLKLARYLTAYAEIGDKYVYTLQSMILHNRFDIYEGYALAPLAG